MEQDRIGRKGMEELVKKSRKMDREEGRSNVRQRLYFP